MLEPLRLKRLKSLFKERPGQEWQQYKQFHTHTLKNNRSAQRCHTVKVQGSHIILFQSKQVQLSIESVSIDFTMPLNSFRVTRSWSLS